MKVLILVLSANFPPYDRMIDTAISTWDSVLVPSVETIFYCGNTSIVSDKIISLPVEESLFNIGRKTLLAFQWALANKSFDYIARVHSSIYVNKHELIEYISTLPATNIFAGIEASSQNGFQYLWGGVGFILSRDVVQKIVDNKDKWNHSYMEDESMSHLASGIGIPFFKGNRVCSIDKIPSGWQCTSYCEKSLIFTDFRDLKPLKHFYYRVKQDGHREQDKFIMNQLFKSL